MALYRDVGDNERIKALRAVGAALSAPTNIIPSQSASQGDQHCWKAMRALYNFKALPLPLSLDYGSFTTAINKLVALVP
jgi:hypothetical protein